MRKLTGWSCPFCDDDLYVETDVAQQPPPEDEGDDCGYSWWANENDVVLCDMCGFRGVVGEDDGEATLRYDEMSEVNGAAWQKAQA